MQADQHFSKDQGSQIVTPVQRQGRCRSPRDVSGEARSWVVAEGRDQRSARLIEKATGAISVSNGDGINDQCQITIAPEDDRALDPGLYWSELRIGDVAEIGGIMTLNGSSTG